MKKEDLFNALSDIDEELIARAKTAEEVFAEPKQITVKKGFSWKLPAAACAAIAGIAATAAAVIINQNGGLPFDPNGTKPDVEETVEPDTSYADLTGDVDIPDVPDLYPYTALYEYKGDFSEVSAIFPEIDIKGYWDYSELADESDIVVMGTFMDNARQDVDPNGLYNGSSIYSFNRFRIEKILKGADTVAVGEDIIIGQSYGVFDNRLETLTLLTPMIKGDSWVYFLHGSYKSQRSQNSDYADLDIYYTVGDFYGRYAAPDSENTPLPAHWERPELNPSENNIYSTICAMLKGSDGTDRTPIIAEYPEGLYPYTGDYSEIINANVPKNLADEDRLRFFTWEDLEKASDIAVIGTFIDDPHQNVDPVPDGSPFGTAITSYNKLRVEKVLSTGGRENDVIDVQIKEGDVLIIKQQIGVYGDSLISVSGLTPMIKGDSWVYFLTGGPEVFTATGDSDGRYPVPGTTNTKLPFYDNDLGVTDTEVFKYDVFDTIKEIFNVGAGHDFTEEIDEYLAGMYPYTGDYSEITDFPDAPYRDKGVVSIGPRYHSYTEAAEASDIVVIGTFVSDPYQDTDPTSTDVFSVISYGKFKVEKILKGSGAVQEGDIILVSQFTGVIGNKLKSSYGLTPIVKGDSWVYFLTGHRGYFAYTANGADRRYPVPERENAKLPFDNIENGVYHESWFNEDIYSVINEKLNPGLTAFAKEITSMILPDKGGYFEISEIEDVYFHYNYTMVEMINDSGKHILFDGMPVRNIYLCDLNGDGRREICSTVYSGSGMVDERIIAYDVVNNKLYQLVDRGVHDYSIDWERTTASSIGTALYYKTADYNNANSYDGGEPVYNILRLEDMELVQQDENPIT